MTFRDVLRVQDGRYWSYVCRDPSCCPADGVPVGTSAHPAAQAMAAAGAEVLPGREALAATLAAVTGPDAEVMARATRRALRGAARLAETEGPRALDRLGLPAAQAAVAAYRNGRPVSRSRHAWLSVVLTRLPVRDDAWARMDPAHRDAHIQLWTDLVRHAQPGYVAAPASLLAFTAWQSGNGALANIALDRALADTPGYSMAELIRQALDVGLAALGGPAADDSRGRRCRLRRPPRRLAISSARGRVQPVPARPFRQLPMLKGVLEVQ